MNTTIGCERLNVPLRHFQSFEVLVTHIAEYRRLQIDDVDEADEVHAVGIEAVPAGALAAASVAVAVNSAVCTENLNPHVMVMKSAKDRV